MRRRRPSLLPVLGADPDIWRRRARRRQVVVTALIGLAVGAIILVGTLNGSVRSAPTPATSSRASAPATSSGPTSTVPAAYLAQFQQVEVALGAATWPPLHPASTALGLGAAAPEWGHDGCLDVTASNELRCRYGLRASPHLAVVIGDSVAISWMPGLRAALGAAGWRIQLLTFGQCPAPTISVTSVVTGPAFVPTCDAHHAFVAAQVQQLHPDMVIMSSAAASLSRLASGATGSRSRAAWQGALTSTLTTLRASSPSVIVLQPPPEGTDLSWCLTPQSRPHDCETTQSAPALAQRLAESAAVARVADAGVRYVDTHEWFCAYGRCPSFIGNAPLLADGTNLTAAASTSLAPVLAQALLQPVAAGSQGAATTGAATGP